jgi:hypothetical protein
MKKRIRRTKKWSEIEARLVAEGLAESKIQRLQKATFIVWVQNSDDAMRWGPYGLTSEAQVVDDINSRKRNKNGRPFLVTRGPLTWTDTVELDIER